MKMRQRRRHSYRQAAYDIRLREFTEALEELADALWAEDRVKIDLPENSSDAHQAEAEPSATK